MNAQPRRAPFELRIDNLSHEGRGVGRVNGKTTFVAGALPTELVRAQVLRRRGRFDEAAVTAILEAAPERVVPLCPYTAACGGCSLQHFDPAAQIRHKQAVLLELLRHHGGVEPAILLPPLIGPLWGYRRRARLGVRYVPKKGGTLVGFRERASARVADIAACAILAPAVGTRLVELRALIETLSVRDRLPQIEVAIGDDDGALVFRHLAPLAAADRGRLEAFSADTGLDIYLQSGGLDTVTALAAPRRPLGYALDDLRISFEPTDFTQVNAEINRMMVTRVRQELAVEPREHVLDLYCGLGNFTLALARGAASITGVEGAPALVARARANAHANGVGNAEFLTSDLGTPAAVAALDGGGYDKVVLDPPRTGAEHVVAALDLSRCARLVYVSCNPVTLARDAHELVTRRGFRLAAAGVMDMFPHTAHVESMAVFERR